MTLPLSSGLSRALSRRLSGENVLGGTYATALLEPAGDNNDILFTAVEPGAAGNAISVTVATPAVSAETAVSVTGNAITITPGTKARVIISGNPVGYGVDLTGEYFFAGNDLGYPVWQRLADGALNPTVFTRPYLMLEIGGIEYLIGHSDAYFYCSAGVFESPESEWLVFEAVPGTMTGTPTWTDSISSANQAISAIAASTPAAALVTAANAPGNDGSGPLAAVAETFLTGGSDAATNILTLESQNLTLEGANLTLG